MRFSLAAALALTTWIAIACGLLMTSAVAFIAQPLALVITIFGPIAALATAIYARGTLQAFALGAMIPLAIGLWTALDEIRMFAVDPQTAFNNATTTDQWTSYPPLSTPINTTLPQPVNNTPTNSEWTYSGSFSVATINGSAIPVWAPLFWRRTGTFSFLAIAGGFLSCLIQSRTEKRTEKNLVP